MLDVRSDGIRALQQDDIESAEAIFDVVTGQVLTPLTESTSPAFGDERHESPRRTHRFDAP